MAILALIVLLLIGETDDDGLPTGTRTLITATYPPEQELSRGGELVGLSGAVPEGETGSTLQVGDWRFAIQLER